MNFNADNPKLKESKSINFKLLDTDNSVMLSIRFKEWRDVIVKIVDQFAEVVKSKQIEMEFEYEN